ncbi:hypothetical protein N9T13_04185 [Candidatus Pelagibacter sp.]|nr:hypothetical protein [Candidatus Pelagibacter sp.]
MLRILYSFILFYIFCINQKTLNADQFKNDPNRAIADFISGMTDRYAINLNKSI